MTNYLFTQHILNDSMPNRNLTRDDVMRVMEEGSTWRHFNYSMRTRLDDLIVCWAQDGDDDTITLITIWDNTNDTSSS